MATSKHLVKIDGNYLEGGGQILRLSLSLSAILKIPINVINIRKGRGKPGLANQHLTGLQLVNKMCGGSLKGASMGSQEITFTPGDIKGGNYCADIKTAGSVSLLIQAAYPCALFADMPTTLNLVGGTDAKMAPPTDYTENVFRRISDNFGANFNMSTKVRGFFPKGGGNVKVEIQPSKGGVQSVEMIDPGKVTKVHGFSFVSGVLPIRMANNMADAAVDRLKSRLDPSVTISIQRRKEEEDAAWGTGNCIFLWAETTTGCIFGGSDIGKRGIEDSTVGINAANEIIEAIEDGGCVDKYCQDQIIILMSLASGKSRVKTGPVTDHTKTAMFVAEQLTTAKFNVLENSKNNSCIIECDGAAIR